MLIKNQKLKAKNEFDFKKVSNNIKKALKSKAILDNLDKFFIQIIEEGNVYFIPKLYKYLESEALTNEEISTLIRSTFELFTKKSIDLYSNNIKPYLSIENQDNFEFEESPKISTLSYNSALDLDVDFNRYPRNSVIPGSYILSPSGKALNVAVGLKQWGLNPIVIGLIGGSTGIIIKFLLEKLNITSKFLIEGKKETRINLYGVHVGEQDPVTISTKGKRVPEIEFKNLSKQIDDVIEKRDILVVSGSFPLGISKRYFGDFLKRMKKKRVEVYVDTKHPEFLRQTIKSGTTLLAINVSEFADALNISLDLLKRNPKKVAALGKEMTKKHDINVIIISMGELGAVLCNRTEAWYAIPPKVEVISTVGAGDTLKVGMAYGRKNEMPLIESFRLAIAGSVATIKKKAVSISTLQEAEGLKDKVKIIKI